MNELCKLDDIACPGTKQFERNGETFFVVRTANDVSAFINQCPHTGAPLNWQPDQFFDYDQRYIQCALHMALFEPVSGKCVWGPCKGDSLTKQVIEVKDNIVYLV